MSKFKDIFEKITVKGVSDTTKEIYKVVKKISTPLDVSIVEDENFVFLYLKGEEIPSGVTTMRGSRTMSGQTADKNEKEFNKFNQKFSKLIKSSSVVLEDYDYYIENTENATIFMVVLQES